MDGDYYVDLNKLPQWALHAPVEEAEGDIDGLKCQACDHTWATRTDQPQTCPNCNANLIWDDSITEEPQILHQSDVSNVSSPNLCDECGEEIEDQEESEPDTGEGAKTLGDLLEGGDK